MDEIINPTVIKDKDRTGSSAIKGRASYLQRTRFLQYATESLINQLAEQMKMIHVPAGTLIMEKGEYGNTMFFIVEGSVRVHDENIDLTDLKSGAIFGEIAALSPKRRTASITANTDCLLYTISQESLYAVVDQQPGAARSIIQGLCDNESQFVQDVTNRAVKVRVLEHELEIGQRIQKGFLPRDRLEIEGWEIESYFKAAREVAGDFYDYFEIKSLGCVALVVADVCDKGVGAALFMTLFRSLIRSSALSYDYADWGHYDSSNRPTPSCHDVLSHSIRLVNQYVATTHSKESMFATIFFALLNPDTGEFSYINAGHEAPCLITPQGNITRFDTTGPIVGLFTEAQHKVKSGRINKGEKMVIFTDGISEAKNLQDEEIGDERVLEILESSSSSDIKRTVSDLITNVKDYSGNAKQFDDITVLAIERH